MIHPIRSLLALSTFLAAGLALGEQPRCAVLGFRPENGSLSDSFSAAISSGLSRTRCVQIVERSRLDVLLSELKLTESGVIDQRSAAKIGNIKDVQYLVYGSIVSYGQVSTTPGNVAIEARVRVSDVGTGRIIFDDLVKGESHRSGESAALSAAASDFAKKFIKVIPATEADVIDIDLAGKAIRLEAGKFSTLQKGDRFAIGTVDERKMSNGMTIQTFNRVCDFQLEEIEAQSIKGYPGSVSKDPFGRVVFKRSDKSLAELDRLMKDGKKLIARPILP